MRSNNWCGECNGSSVSAAAGSRQHQWQHQRHLLTWFSAWQRFAESCASVLVLGAAGAGASVGVCVETAAVDAASNSSPEYWLLSASPSDAPNSCSCATRVHTNALDAGCSSAGVWSCNRCDQSYLVVFAVVLCIYRCFGLLAVAPLVHQLHFCECRVRRHRFLVHIARAPSGVARVKAAASCATGVEMPTPPHRATLAGECARAHVLSRAC